MTIHRNHTNSPFSDFEKVDGYVNTPEDYEEIPMVTAADLDRATFKIAGVPTTRPGPKSDADDLAVPAKSSAGFYLASVCVAVLTFTIGSHFHSTHAWGPAITCFAAFFFLTLLLLVELVRSMNDH